MDEHTATTSTTTHTTATPSAARAFIERQLPVSKLSKESYKERKSNMGQTLTALGKWWGRKPLVLVRAIIQGLLLPDTDDTDADRETFLALMTMDDDGMLRRLDAMPAAKIYGMLTPREQAEYFTTEGGKLAWRRETGKLDRKSVTHRAFLRMGYDERLLYCKRPEEIDGPSPEAWQRINAHLGTQATSLAELVAELGARRFGGVPRVGDV
ncbi:MAG TPA: DUF1156 domain-containing protein, partial [Ktedonobacterales bacterium]|nr:DUF1156 domain-containing protein [Ktedonobacterales bacterium]